MWWVLLACVGEQWEAVSVEDEGDLCLYTGDFDVWATVGEPAGAESTFTSTDPITAHYVPLSCFSSSCTRNIDIACSATVQGSDIVIEGTGGWEVASGPNQECTADCGLGDTRCTIEPLPEGTYEVQFGSDSAPLTIPSTATVCLHAD
jgi:hypothetical protein